MLDSTGDRKRMVVNCFICGNLAMEFDVWTPLYGHTGEELNVGSCIRFNYFHTGSSDRIQNGSKLFEIKLNESASSVCDPLVKFAESELVPSQELYHYDGFLMKDFGDSVGEVMCICKNCLLKPELFKVCEETYRNNLQRDIKLLIFNLFVEGFLAVSVKGKSRRMRFLQKIEPILNELKKFEHPHISGLYQRLLKMLKIRQRAEGGKPA